MGEFIMAKILNVLFRELMFNTDLGLWTIFCSAEVIKSTLES